MAIIDNITLSMGKVRGSRNEYADVTFDILFSQGEVRLDLLYDVLIYIAEEDDGPDILLLKDYNKIVRSRQGKPDSLATFRRKFDSERDEAVYYFWDTVTPNRRSRISYRRRLTFDVGNQESGMEEYRAHIFVIPEVTWDYGMSSRFNANLG